MKHWKDNLKIIPASFLASLFLVSLDKTVRIKLLNYKSIDKPCIYAVWHGNQYVFGGLPEEVREKLLILVSQSNDGQIITNVLSTLGISTVRGSHKRGGAKALREILSSFDDGYSLGYTVDGPRGPIYKVKEGLIKIAQLGQVPVIPVVPASKWKMTFNSWDKYQMPLPFSKSVVAFGEPINIPEDITKEQVAEYQIQIENSLLELKNLAENTL